MPADSNSKNLTFLVKDAEEADQTNTGFRRLSAACRQAGWQVKVAEVDSLSLIDNQPHWRCCEHWENTTDTRLLWLVSFGRQSRFLDKMQLLALAEQNIPLINSTRGLVFWHSKYFSASMNRTGIRTPTTLASGSADWLWAEIKRRGGHWVAKPPAGSCGKGVYRLHPKDEGGRSILQQLTDQSHCLVQRYIPEIVAGEKRVLLAGGEVIGQYKRLPEKDFRANLACEGRAVGCSLNDSEYSAMKRLAKELREQGVLFAGIDLCWPWLIEINVVNPGGLDTMARLYGEDSSCRVVDAVERALGFKASTPSRIVRTVGSGGP